MNLSHYVNYVLLLTLSVFSSPLIAIELVSNSMVTQHSSSSISNAEWQDNPSSQPWAANNPEFGSTLSIQLLDFPKHLRRVGPDSNNNLTPLLNSLHLPLIAKHPLDGQWIPMLAQRWWFDNKHNRVVFELHPDALWSDGTPVTTEDIRFSFEFLLNPNKQTHWQRARIHDVIKRVEIYDDHRFAFVSKHPLTEQFINELAAFKPLAKHFYRDLDWPNNANWSIEPTTGPYALYQIHHNESLSIRRISPWWGDELRYFSDRFNIARVQLLLINADDNSLHQFKRADLDILHINTDEKDHPLVKNLWEKQHINMYSWQQDSKTNTLFLLNSNHEIFNTVKKRSHVLKALSAKENVALPLTYNNSEILEFLNSDWPIHMKTKLSNDDLLANIQNSQFILAAITFTNDLDNSSADNWLSQLGIKKKKSSHLLFNDTNTHYTMAWPWLNLPENMEYWPTNPFDPFDAVTGGLFWIDKRKRAEMLLNPARTDKKNVSLIPIGLAQ